MKTTALKIPISASLGSVSAEIFEPEHAIAILTFAHGAKAGMNHSFMTSLAKSLAKQGIATLRFNFPYMEQKKKLTDSQVITNKTLGVVMEKTHELFPNLPFFAAGKSFGGHMSSLYLSTASLKWVKGIIFYGFPLHPAGLPLTERAEHLKTLKLPMLFIQGSADEVAELALIEKVTSNLPMATLHKLGTDHAFHTTRLNLLPNLTKFTHDWITQVLG